MLYEVITCPGAGRSAAEEGSPAGSPSTTTPTALPWDSPQVVIRNICPKIVITSYSIHYTKLYEHFIISESFCLEVQQGSDDLQVILNSVMNFFYSNFIYFLQGFFCFFALCDIMGVKIDITGTREWSYIYQICAIGIGALKFTPDAVPKGSDA